MIPILIKIITDIIKLLQNAYIPKVATCHHQNEAGPEVIQPTHLQAVVATKIHIIHKATAPEPAQLHPSSTKKLGKSKNFFRRPILNVNSTWWA